MHISLFVRIFVRNTTTPNPYTMSKNKFVKKAKFILNEAQTKVDLQDQKPTLILLTFQCSDGKFKYSTKQQILPKDWDGDEYAAIKDTETNNRLHKLSEYVEEYFDQFPRSERKERRKDVTREKLKVWMDIKTEKSKTGTAVEFAEAIHPNFFKVIHDLIQDAKNGKLLTPNKKQKYSTGTLKNWNKTLEILKKFNSNLGFDITLIDYNDFIVHCHTENYSNNYIGSLIKDWKTFMEKTSGEFHNNDIYRNKKFATLREKIDLPYLNDEEIELIKNVTGLTGMQEIIRDRFVVNLYNGLRISDMERLDFKEHFDGDNIIITTAKTDTQVVIPIADEVKDILKKYGNELPKQYHRNVVNRELKNIAEKAGLTGNERITKTVAGESVTIKKKKFQLISNHTARRSHATNLLKQTDFFTAQPILGMSLKTLDLYNKRTGKENAKRAKSLPMYSRKVSV